jgi:hypothetical protein
MKAVCGQCDKSLDAKPAKGERGYCLPRGWHEVEDGPYAGIWCKDCLHAKFVPRCLVIPVAGPVGATWVDLRAALRQCWEWSTAVANWATTELARADTPRKAGDKKLAKAPALYLYPGVEAVAPGMDSSAKVAVLNTVTKNYDEKRFDVLWKRDASFPAYHYPYPYLVGRKNWLPILDPAEQRPAIQVRLAGRRWILRLAGGFRNRRKIEGFMKLLSGEAIRREVAITSRRVTPSAHRIGTTAPGGGPRRHQRVMVEISGYFPRQESRAEPDLVMEVKTTQDSFLSYRIGVTGGYRHIHGDHVRRWRAQYTARSARFAHDLKYEKRWTAKQRRMIRDRWDAQAKKLGSRIDTWLHEVSKIIAEYAYRRRVAKVILDVRYKGFAPAGFPWSKLKQYVQYKLDDRRIKCDVVDSDVSDVPEGDSGGDGGDGRAVPPGANGDGRPPGAKGRPRRKDPAP